MAGSWNSKFEIPNSKIKILKNIQGVVLIEHLLRFHGFCKKINLLIEKNQCQARKRQKNSPLFFIFNGVFCNSHK